MKVLFCALSRFPLQDFLSAWHFLSQKMSSQGRYFLSTKCPSCLQNAFRYNRGQGSIQYSVSVFSIQYSVFSLSIQSQYSVSVFSVQFSVSVFNPYSQLPSSIFQHLQVHYLKFNFTKLTRTPSERYRKTSRT